MTDDQFARRLPGLMQQLAGDDDSYIDDVLSVTAGMSQRRALTFVGKWIPAIGVRDRAPKMRARFHPAVVVIVVIAIIALLAATVLYFGSQNQRQTILPSLGVSNGWIAYSTSGRAPAGTDITTGSDIYLVRAGVAPRLIASRDGGTTRNDCPAFSPDGTRLAFDVISDPGSAIVVLGVDATGVTSDVARITVPGSGPGECVRWSSDGTRVADEFDLGHQSTDPLLSPAGDRIVRIDSSDSGCGVAVASPDGANARVLALDFCPYAIGAWSPDGRQVLLMEDVGGAFTIHAVEVDSPFAMVTIVSNVPVNGARSWPGSGDVSWQPVEAKPSGRSGVSNGWVAFAVGDGDPRGIGPSDIYLAKNGVAERRIIGSDGDGLRQVCPAFSPDGTKLAYSEASELSDVNAPSAVMIVTLGADGLPVGPVMRFVAPSTGDVCPKWAPDGQSIAFLANQQSPQLWIARLEGTETQVVASEGIPLMGFSGAFDWSPDGTALVAVAFDGSSIWIVPVGAGHARLLPHAGPQMFDQPSYQGRPKWLSDGTRIAVAGTAFAPDGATPGLPFVEVYRADGTGSPIELTGGTSLAWSPDGTRIAFVRSTEQEGFEHDDIVIVTPGAGDGRVIASEVSSIVHLHWIRGLIWSPDGMRLIYVADEGVSGRLVSVSADGDPAPITLTQQSHNVEFTDSNNLSWQPVFP